MQNFEFHNPTRVLFGKNETAKIGSATAAYGKKVMLLYGGGSVKKSGLYDRVCASLKEAGVEWVNCGGVKSNPILSFAKAAITTYRKNDLEAIVAVGGGSVIDTAKTIAAGVYYEGDVWDFFINKARVKKAAPLTTVLTLAASASEMNSGGVITNEETLQKFNIDAEPLFPKASILDPENTYTVPINYSMYGVVDCITHVLEGYFNCCDNYTPLQDRISEGIIRSVMEGGSAILKNPKDYTARANVMWSATLGLNGITTSGIGVTGFPNHMIEHSLSAIYDIAHGAGLAIVLPAWMKYTSQEDPKKYAQFAERIFDIRQGGDEQKAAEGIAALKAYFKSIEVPTSLQEADIPASDIPKIAENAVMLAKKWGLKDYTAPVIAEVLELAS